MKSLLKFLITLIVVALVAFVIYYLMINGETQNGYASGDTFNSGEIESINSGEHSPFVSGEYLPEVYTPQSGEIPPVVDPIQEIDNKVQNIDSGEIVKTIEDKLAPEVIGESARDFLKYFNQTELSVTVNIKEGMVEVIPTIDFLENQVFYYDEEGNLILYESISNTVEGICKYYFDKNENIKIVTEYEEGIEHITEDITDILNRAKELYNKYYDKNIIRE